MVNLNIYYILFAVVFFCSILCKIEGQNVTYCNATTNCNSLIEYSYCKNNTCQCPVDHYVYQDRVIKICVQCPGLGQYCGPENCCSQSDYLKCSDNICRCRNPYDGYYCWDENAPDSSRIEFLAQYILGIGLVFTFTILGSLIWRSCRRRNMIQQTQNGLQRDGSYSSLNSLQRLVIARLQDRPPPYNRGYQPWKYFNNSGLPNPQPFPSEAPPPYTITGNQVPIIQQDGGIANPVFSVEELRQDTAASLPPNLNNPNDNRPKNN